MLGPGSLPHRTFKSRSKHPKYGFALTDIAQAREKNKFQFGKVH